jgi:hypothetical protein
MSVLYIPKIHMDGFKGLVDDANFDLMKFVVSIKVFMWTTDCWNNMDGRILST